MSGFKEMVQADLDRVFLNPDEFGEERVIEGETVICVTDNTILKQMGNVTQATVTEADLLIYAKICDLPSQRGYGDELMVDEIPYTILSWDEDMGMATIALAIAANA